MLARHLEKDWHVFNILFLYPETTLFCLNSSHTNTSFSKVGTFLCFSKFMYGSMFYLCISFLNTVLCFICLGQINLILIFHILFFFQYETRQTGRLPSQPTNQRGIAKLHVTEKFSKQTRQKMSIFSGHQCHKILLQNILLKLTLSIP